MLLTLLQFFATKFLFLALHLESGSFPKPLSAREEQAAFAALRAGDAAAREKLIRHNLRLVAHIVKKYYALPGDQEDLVSIGTIGLMKAVDTFDSTLCQPVHRKRDPDAVPAGAQERADRLLTGNLGGRRGLGADLSGRDTGRLLHGGIL